MESAISRSAPEDDAQPLGIEQKYVDEEKERPEAYYRYYESENGLHIRGLTKNYAWINLRE
ncbi:MAG TPA: hypothetical protein VII64_08110, partial [Thermodesulfobacteriota bacterium]